jgi:LmbE family N-acetylglucosaminyl deacetylase
MSITLNNPTADAYVPDGTPFAEALARTTHMGIGAHQDDLEFMAFHGILACYGAADRWFAGVTCTNGAGSPRAGVYASYTDERMQAVRRREQRLAADVGQYGSMVQLDYPSAAVKDPRDPRLVADLAALLRAARPQVVYTHNLADKHETHVAVAVAAIRALRSLPPGDRPRKVYGCEVWRDLDWMPDAERVLFDVSGRDSLAMALAGVFDSQIAGGKRYDLASQGRRRSNATFAESHGVDVAEQVNFAMDLAPVVQDDTLDLTEYVVHFVRAFEADVRQKISSRLPG